jgi:putative Holliday junction resolvase
MRVLGVDLGTRRIGLALSDDTATLARPWQTIAAGPNPRASAETLAALVDAGRRRDDDELAGIGAVVVGLPRRLNGDDTQQSQPTREFAAALAERVGLAVHLQDERLTSVEAESRLAVLEKDWRRRKAKLDAASAAIILQDYLDEAAR